MSVHSAARADGPNPAPSYCARARRGPRVWMVSALVDFGIGDDLSEACSLLHLTPMSLPDLGDREPERMQHHLRLGH